MDKKVTFKNAALKISGSANYTRVQSVQELLGLGGKLRNLDLSDLDLSDYANMFDGQLDPTISQAEAAKNGIVLSWTDSVIWPSEKKLPNGVNPAQILQDSKKPFGITEAHKAGKTGRGVSIAIIDQRLNREHDEYADRIKYYDVGNGYQDKNGIDYHGSLVAGCAVGKNTGTAPDADLYYFAAPMIKITDDNERVITREYVNAALKKLLALNKTLPENQKIHFVSCSWGARSDLFTAETDALFRQCEADGMMILGGAYKPLPTVSCDARYPNKNKFGRIGIPTDGKTSPFLLGGYAYTRAGGSSSTFPYIAGVFASATQGNQIFFTRPNWQNELKDILVRTATESKNGGKIINPDAIVREVTRISREMEMNLLKQKSVQNE